MRAVSPGRIICIVGGVELGERAMEKHMFRMMQGLQEVQQQIATLQAAVAAGNGGGPQPHRLGIDARQLSKPDTFTGDDKQIKDWAIVFDSYASLVNPCIAGLFRAAETNT